MGKGDLKTKRGKISRGTYGVTRKRNSSSTTVVSKPKAEKATAKKTTAKKTTTKKAASKKA